MENKLLKKTNKKFPKLKVVSTHGTITLPEFYRGKSFLVVYSSTFLNPAQAVDLALLARNINNFKSKKCEIACLTPDNIFMHYEWINWISENCQTIVKFPMCSISLKTKEVLEKLLEKNRKSKTFAVLVVDKDGKIREGIEENGQIQDNLQLIYEKILSINNQKSSSRTINLDLLGSNINAHF